MLGSIHAIGQGFPKPTQTQPIKKTPQAPDRKPPAKPVIVAKNAGPKILINDEDRRIYVRSASLSVDWRVTDVEDDRAGIDVQTLYQLFKDSKKVTEGISGSPSERPLTLTGLDNGSYALLLTAIDSKGAKSPPVSIYLTVEIPLPAPPIVQIIGPRQLMDTSRFIIFMAIPSKPDPQVSYHWQSTDAKVDLSGKSAGSELRLFALEPGVYGFKVTATDAYRQSTETSFNVTVTKYIPKNKAPIIVTANRKFTVRKPESNIDISVDASDPENDELSYAWEKVSGVSYVTTYGEQSSKLSLLGLSEGTYVYRLTVSDKEGASVSTDFEINVLAATENQENTPQEQSTPISEVPDEPAPRPKRERKSIDNFEKRKLIFLNFGPVTNKLSLSDSNRVYDFFLSVGFGRFYVKGTFGPLNSISPKAKDLKNATFESDDQRVTNYPVNSGSYYEFSRDFYPKVNTYTMGMYGGYAQKGFAIDFYGGLGYGSYDLIWGLKRYSYANNALIGISAAKNVKQSVSGPCIEGGLLLHLGFVHIMGGTNLIMPLSGNKPYVSGHIGLGLSFTK